MSPVLIEQTISDLAEQLFDPAAFLYAQTHSLRLGRPRRALDMFSVKRTPSQSPKIAGPSAYKEDR